MLAKQEEGEIRAGCRGNMSACWKVDINGHSKHNESAPGSVCARTCLCMQRQLARVWSWLADCSHSGSGIYVSTLTNLPGPRAFTPVWSMCSINNLLLSKWVNCKCIKCMISADVSSWTHNRIIKSTSMGKCSIATGISAALSHTNWALSCVQLSCKADRLVHLQTPV